MVFGVRSLIVGYFCTGCVLYASIFGGVIRTFGVFFLQFQERFQAKAAEVALMSLIQNIVVSITGEEQSIHVEKAATVELQWLVYHG